MKRAEAVSLSSLGPDGQEHMPYLLTPGPLTTSASVKRAMLEDWGSRDIEFRKLIQEIRTKLLALAGCDSSYECVIVQGSGTFAIEAALGTLCPMEGKTLVVVNGAYGERAAQILSWLGRPVTVLVKTDEEAPSAEEVAAALDGDPAITHLWLIHCETTSGIVNPVQDIAREAKGRKKVVMVDAMSSFGAIPLDLTASGIDVMVSSSNKCIEGVPGFSYVLCRRALLEGGKGLCHSVVLDLFEQWQGLERTGQFRFTPPTHALVAFRQALKEHALEGGVQGRGARYRRNAARLVAGMRRLGFTTLLNDKDAGPIIQTFLTPRDPNFDFERFYEALRSRGFAIYPGKLTKRASFRIGTIGQLDEAVIGRAIEAVQDTLRAMKVRDLAPLDT
jgi:2-aminoethylphosphonate-pyruvate transaminase